MKSFILGAVFACTFIIGRAQTASTCTPSASFATSYSDEVKYLALNRMYALRAADTGEIEIPQAYQDTIQGGMAAIWNVDSLVQGDSVFRSYCIHEHSKNYALMVQVDTAYAWTHQWLALNTTTGIAALDSLTAGHHFTVTHFYLWGFANYAVLTTDHIVNLNAMGDSLMQFSGILYAQADNGAGDGSHITYQTDSVRHYSFCLGWGDCPSGCTSTKTWNYKVDASCNVTLASVVASATDTWPQPVNCNRPATGTPAVDNISARISPNPTSNFLHISVDNNGSYNYSISDLCGRRLLAGKVSDNTAIDLENLRPGIFVLTVTDNAGGYFRQKVVKR